MEDTVPLYATRLRRHSRPPTRVPLSHRVGLTGFMMQWILKTCTLHATVIAKVGGLQARIMLDSGAGSSYISSSLLTELKLKPYRTERRVIEQMYGKVDKLFEIYKVRVESNAIEGFELELRCINAEKPVWLWL